MPESNDEIAGYGATTVRRAPTRLDPSVHCRRRDALRREVAGWGARRRDVLDRLIARTGVMPPLGQVTDAYVDLRSWAVRTGHGLGARAAAMGGVRSVQKLAADATIEDQTTQGWSAADAARKSG